MQEAMKQNLSDTKQRPHTEIQEAIGWYPKGLEETKSHRWKGREMDLPQNSPLCSKAYTRDTKRYAHIAHSE